MRYRTYIRKRKSRGRQEWLARLIWEDLAVSVPRLGPPVSRDLRFLSAYSAEEILH